MRGSCRHLAAARVGGALAAALLTAALAGCGAAGRTEAPSATGTETVEVTIPSSYLRFAGMDPQEQLEAIEADGTATFDAARIENGGLVLTATPGQLETYRASCREQRDAWVGDFLEAGDGYAFEASDDGRSLAFFCDESIGPVVSGKAFLGVTAMYAMEQVLDGDPDWSVEITVINCHTKSEVGRVTLPDGELTLTQEMWERSYAG